jgi:hypothetical protein
VGAPLLAPYYEARPSFQDKGLRLRAYDDPDCGMVIVFRRMAYIHWDKSLMDMVGEQEPIVRVERAGVTLAAAYARPR